jgi:hypothetical protein
MVSKGVAAAAERDSFVNTGLKPNFAEGASKLSGAESTWVIAVQNNLEQDAGYREIQSTKPNTAAIGIFDSPAALAAWIADKFHSWNGGRSVH